VVIILGVAGFLLKDKFLGPSKVTETTVATAPPPKTPAGPVEKPHPADGAVMVQIPAGPFTMGSDKYSAEQPVQKIAMDPYWIDKYLVTNEMFKKFVDASGYKTDAEKSGGGMVRIGRRWRNVPEATWQMPDGLSPIDDKMDHPVAQVSYNDALAYCKWAKKDLPTEAQWEKAARGTDGRVFPWGDNPPDDTVANFDNIVGNTTPVKRYEKGASPFGLQDMAGNVYQWCKDWWGTGPRAEKNPTGPAKGKERVVKGGSFVEGEESLRSANRDRYAPDYSSYLFGFRCRCEKF
jgi:formylglycine-generating enzyme required for sulfatase activity